MVITCTHSPRNIFSFASSYQNYYKDNKNNNRNNHNTSTEQWVLKWRAWGFYLSSMEIIMSVMLKEGRSTPICLGGSENGQNEIKWVTEISCNVEDWRMLCIWRMKNGASKMEEEEAAKTTSRCCKCHGNKWEKSDVLEKFLVVFGCIHLYFELKTH